MNPPAISASSPPGRFPRPQSSSFRLKPTPRLPRHQREPQETLSPFVLSVAALRLKTQELILKAVETGMSQDTALFDQITAEAGAFNAAATWLASQAYPARVQTGHPLSP